MKRIKLPPANAYKYPYRGYKYGSTDFYKELRINKEQWLKFRAKLLAKQGFKCAYCMCDLHGKRMNVEHIIPISRGGGNDSNNLVAACSNCNKNKGHKRLTKVKTRELQANLKRLKRDVKIERRKIAQSYLNEEEYQEKLGNDLRRMFTE